MKKILLMLCVMMFLCEFLFSQKNNVDKLSIKGQKSRFDFQPERANQLKSSSFDASRRMVQDEVWEYSMMREGYFTLGTNQVFFGGPGRNQNDGDMACIWTGFKGIAQLQPWLSVPMSMVSGEIWLTDTTKTIIF